MLDDRARGGGPAHPAIAGGEMRHCVTHASRVSHAPSVAACGARTSRARSLVSVAVRAVGVARLSSLSHDRCSPLDPRMHRRGCMRSRHEVEPHRHRSGGRFEAGAADRATGRRSSAASAPTTVDREAPPQPGRARPRSCDRGLHRQDRDPVAVQRARLRRPPQGSRTPVGDSSPIGSRCQSGGRKPHTSSTRIDTSA